MPFVLDNSVVSGWLLQSQATPYALAVSECLQSDRAYAPTLLALEYTNVLRTACKRGRLTAQSAQILLALLARLPIQVDAQVPMPAMLFALALRHDLTSYDALYLELGLRLQLPIATQDLALAAAARAAGIGVWSPRVPDASAGFA